MNSKIVSRNIHFKEQDERVARWQKKHLTPLDIDMHRDELLALFDAVRAARDLSSSKLNSLIMRLVHDDVVHVTQDKIVAAYRAMTARDILPFEREVLNRLRLKPVRTSSGVAPLTVLTAAAPCPGKCIFCPEVSGYPKSYLPLEPGVQRAAQHRFDPFKQVRARLQSFENNGHATDKIELLVLGGTWSAYAPNYQERFVRRMFDALNGVESESLELAQQCNETAEHRAVGLTLETRPDHITLDEVKRLRWLGATKIQLGIQSLDDHILELNRRGETTADQKRAIRLLRLAGFKLHLHWMPNLLGATPESDRTDFARLWNDPAYRPDELKIYPCGLIEGTELFTRWQAGDYRPYRDDELTELIVDCKRTVPPYCRLNRVIRDIPANYIAAGSTRSDLRLAAQRVLRERGIACQCIRCREVRHEKIAPDELRLDSLAYETDATTEHFLSFVTSRNQLAAFLRLSLPSPHASRDEMLDELRDCAIIREVHVYGNALEIGSDSDGAAQHSGLGARLIEHAIRIARDAGFKRIAVISAIGTRAYYRKHGFELDELYMTRSV
ncbi:MAG: tRNA uridine(34) 5-carboxymethylaminomethyl modification radical SAM/GNAT enzyme Elp3 [Chloroflexi bacterium]|nr:tRNA uridine(34) 5-carboxymethylaminomethyl modification radical SAM/GNAT enzyme Elp3 [Chloroflexota bacterium]